MTIGVPLETVERVLLCALMLRGLWWEENITLHVIYFMLSKIFWTSVIHTYRIHNEPFT